MDLTRKFRRLLADYEELVRAETIALREENLPALADVQARKPSVFTALQVLGHELAFTRDSPELRLRIEKLEEVTRENSRWLDLALIRLRAEREQISGTNHRLKQFGRAYAAPSAALAHDGLNARG